MKKHIPNSITCLNLFSGCVGVLMLLAGNYTVAFYCVLLAFVFDFFDGMLARWLHVKSPMGKELDSLADVISFGFLPGTLLYTLFRQATTDDFLPYFGFLLTVFSALRLAKFNIDERQSSDFIGVGTPMNTFLIISLPFIAEQYPAAILNSYTLIGITLISSLLLISEIPLFSMKLSSLTWQANKYRYIFVIVSVLLIIGFKMLAVPVIFALYLLLSFLHFGRFRA